MQYKPKDYNEEIHDRFKALTVKQPYASNLIEFSHKKGDYDFAYKSIEVRRKPTKYRGDVLICSSHKPIIYGLESGVSIGFVELYDIKPISEFTPEDWENTMISEDQRKLYKNGFGWMMRNPRKVIEFPIYGQLGIWNLIYSKAVIVEYPKNVILDDKIWKKINNEN